jgi:hypothetical protein
MSAQSASLTTYNNELVACIEDLREKREELNRSILRDEEEKAKIQKVRVRRGGHACRAPPRHAPHGARVGWGHSGRRDGPGDPSWPLVWRVSPDRDTHNPTPSRRLTPIREPCRSCPC